MAKISTDKIMSISAILIALGTFFTIFFQTRILREQQHASALPYLMIDNTNKPPAGVNSEDYYGLVLKNNGIGPAFIDSINIVFGGKKYSTDPAGFVKQIKVSNKFGYSNVYPGMLLPAGEQVTMLHLTEKDDISTLHPLFARDSVDIILYYSSVYKERWKYIRGKLPERID